ncbi:RluA family pseudouridine synthase [Dysgonomonas sp. GY617]|uniref:RluA family pseudouridine synthase n=1 Tax=Dysgonomonas sp. GY617 TaxID=2780420 RepID=UPI0018841B19|nr:RluA family pseudouridine synthase [Dysgonomonas sp. GY617]MBF0575302.1 RluA family pseudouridine synthase [Dysgonomonas sp. GY617]
MKEKQNTLLLEIKVTENAELLNFLVDSNVRKSRNATKSLLVHKQIRVNNKVVSQHNHELKAGDTVSIHKHDHKMDQKKLKGLTIIYEDKDLIVVDKDSGLLSVSTGRELLKETAYNIINEYVKGKNAKERAYVLFRLDRETSGLMVFAKSPEIQEELQHTWILNPLKRSYLGVIEGPLVPEKGTITSWLTENKNFVVFASKTDNGGLEAVTEYETLKANSRYSVIRLTPTTSRKNQLRVQLQFIGHPIVGDKKYGSKISPLRRIALHADELEFVHPKTKQKIQLSSPLPKKMQVMVDAIQPKKKEVSEE